MFNFLAVSTVRFDKKLLEEVALSAAEVRGAPGTPDKPRGVPTRDEIARARQLVEEYFAEDVKSSSKRT